MYLARRDSHARWTVPEQEFSFCADRSRIFRFYLEQNPARLLGNEFGKSIGPFDHRNAISKEIIVESQLRDRFSIFKTKKIEMINGQTPIEIFVNNCKGGAGNRDAAFQSRNEPLGELSFAASKFAFERQDRPSIEFPRELPADCLSLRCAIGNERSHLLIADYGVRSADLDSRCV